MAEPPLPPPRGVLLPEMEEAEEERGGRLGPPLLPLPFALALRPPSALSLRGVAVPFAVAVAVAKPEESAEAEKLVRKGPFGSVRHATCTLSACSVALASPALGCSHRLTISASSSSPALLIAAPCSGSNRAKIASTAPSSAA